MKPRDGAIADDEIVRGMGADPAHVPVVDVLDLAPRAGLTLDRDVESRQFDARTFREKRVVVLDERDPLAGSIYWHHGSVARHFEIAAGLHPRRFAPRHGTAGRLSPYQLLIQG